MGHVEGAVDIAVGLYQRDLTALDHSVSDMMFFGHHFTFFQDTSFFCSTVHLSLVLTFLSFLLRHFGRMCLTSNASMDTRTFPHHGSSS